MKLVKYKQRQLKPETYADFVNQIIVFYLN